MVGRAGEGIHDFVDGGGVLLVDADGGSAPFAQSVRDGLLPAGVREPDAEGAGVDDPLMAATFPGCSGQAPASPVLGRETRLAERGVIPADGRPGPGGLQRLRPDHRPARHRDIPDRRIHTRHRRPAAR